MQDTLCKIFVIISVAVLFTGFVGLIKLPAWTRQRACASQQMEQVPCFHASCMTSTNTIRYLTVIKVHRLEWLGYVPECLLQAQTSSYWKAS
jgi:hypothetical protein